MPNTKRIDPDELLSCIDQALIYPPQGEDLKELQGWMKGYEDCKNFVKILIRDLAKNSNS